MKSCIQSTWALELLLLARAEAPRTFTRDELVLQLRATRSLMSACSSQLQSAGLLSCDEAGNCRYAPATPVLEQLCEQLERAYRERPVAVINAIVATPSDRLRDFADAFRFTKKDE